MASLFFGQLTRTGVPADEKTVRSTTSPVYDDKPPAMQTDMPEQSEMETDTDPNLAGLAPRQLASKWVEGSRANQPISLVAEQSESNQMINRQVDTSGTAAAREAAGQTHKNASYAIGIEPVGDLADENHQFGNTYFVRDQRGPNATAGEYMTVPPGMGNPGLIENVAAEGKDNARVAAESSVYNTFGDFMGWGSNS